MPPSNPASFKPESASAPLHRPLHWIILGFWLLLAGILETYRKALGKDSTLILSTDSELFCYLKHSSPTNAASVPTGP